MGWVSARFGGRLEVIQQTRCHVIVHWHAGTDVMNYFLPFLPLAPVQCIGFGANGTTGIANIDYFISSRLFERDDDAAEDYTERLVCFQGLTAWQERPRVCTAATRAELGLPGSGRSTCPQQLVKFHPAFDRLLSQILEKDRHGRVVLLAGHRPHAAEALRSRFENTLGKSLVKRVSLLSSRRPLEYYRLMSAMDVVLDSPAYSASLTGYDAFAFGIPVVTMPEYMVRGMPRVLQANGDQRADRVNGGRVCGVGRQARGRRRFSRVYPADNPRSLWRPL